MPVAFVLALILQQSTPAPVAAPEAATPVAPVGVTANANTAANGVADPQEQIVCRRERVVGSNRPQRICAPRRVWDSARDSAQDASRNANSRETPNSSTPL